MPGTRGRSSWGLRLARHPWICRSLAAGSLAVELAFPLALFRRLLRPLIVSAALAMQIGITLVMGPDFGPFIWSCLFRVPWDRPARALRDGRRAVPGERSIVADPHSV